MKKIQEISHFDFDENGDNTIVTDSLIKALQQVNVKKLNKSERDRYNVMILTGSKAEALQAIIEGTGRAYLSKQLARIAEKFNIEMT